MNPRTYSIGRAICIAIILATVPVVLAVVLLKGSINSIEYSQKPSSGSAGGHK